MFSKHDQQHQLMLALIFAVIFNWFMPAFTFFTFHSLVPLSLRIVFLIGEWMLAFFVLYQLAGCILLLTKKAPNKIKDSKQGA